MICQTGSLADDSNLLCKISQQADGISSQNDLRQLELWTDRWQLALNPDKCKVMHLGHDYNTTYMNFIIMENLEF